MHSWYYLHACTGRSSLLHFISWLVDYIKSCNAECSNIHVYSSKWVLYRSLFSQISFCLWLVMLVLKKQILVWLNLEFHLFLLLVLLLAQDVLTVMWSSGMRLCFLYQNHHQSFGTHCPPLHFQSPSLYSHQCFLHVLLFHFCYREVMCRYPPR